MSGAGKIAKKQGTFWGNTLGWAAAAVTTPIALAKGAIEAADGGSFEAGFEDVFRGTFDKAKQFGDEHGETITSGVVSGLTVAVVAAITGKPSTNARP